MSLDFWDFFRVFSDPEFGITFFFLDTGGRAIGLGAAGPRSAGEGRPGGLWRTGLK
jgi:hypothetical protein